MKITHKTRLRVSEWSLRAHQLCTGRGGPTRIRWPTVYRRSRVSHVSGRPGLEVPPEVTADPENVPTDSTLCGAEKMYSLPTSRRKGGSFDSV